MTITSNQSVILRNYNSKTDVYVDVGVGFAEPAIYSVSDVVPEPAAWAMMIAGFGLTGTALRNRRRLAA